MPILASSKNLTQDDILRTLESIRNQRQQPQTYFQPQPYTSFMPDTQQGYQPEQNQMWRQNLQGIDQQGKDATALSLTIAQNKAALESQKQAKLQKHFAHQQLVAQANATAANGAAAGQSAGGQQHTPLAPAKGFNINAPKVTRQWHGFNLTMNSSVIGRFTHFLDALSAEGYKIKSIGTYSNRNIAGTNVQSLHALGLAMDINPSDNPVTYNGHVVTNLPSNVGSLAARYGIQWGGAWLHSKMDPMHFSVPYGGRE